MGLATSIPNSIDVDSNLLNDVNVTIKGDPNTPVGATVALDGNLLNNVNATATLNGSLLNNVNATATLNGNLLNNVNATAALNGNLLNNVGLTASIKELAPLLLSLLWTDLPLVKFSSPHRYKLAFSVFGLELFAFKLEGESKAVTAKNPGGNAGDIHV